MSTPPADRLLKVALTVVGLIFIVGIYPLTRLWPTGWYWEPAQPAYLQMILSIYAVLGVFLLRAARDPGRHLSLIWFTIWSSVAHAAIMAVHAVTDPGQIAHLWGDVAALFIVALALGVLTRRTAPTAATA